MNIDTFNLNHCHYGNNWLFRSAGRVSKNTLPPIWTIIALIISVITVVAAHVLAAFN